METNFIGMAFVCVCVAIIVRVFHSRDLPPGPLHLLITNTILCLLKPLPELEPILRNLHAKYGPIITLHFLFGPIIFIADRSLAHQALIQNGAAFAHRPKFLSYKSLINDHLSITSSSYDAVWRVLRRNLTFEMLNPTRFRSFSTARKHVLDDLLNRLKFDAESNHSVKVIDHIRHAMFSLLVFICFGESVGDDHIQNIQHVHRLSIMGFSRFSVLNLLPKVVSSMLFRKRYHELLHLWKVQKDLLVPLIEKRLGKIKEDNDPNECTTYYVDTLLNLQLPKENRKLREGEIVTLCSEFLYAGTDTTSTALEWVMANLVKHRHMQQRLVAEIGGLVGEREEREVKEEDLNKLPYLRAVILEGLRRHPPSLVLLPHAVTEDVVLNGYLVPKHVTVNFMVAEMGWDPSVWEDPMEFKPERFLGIEFDITGSKGIKMMPFGAGRRICPAYNLAMLHLEYFVANLVWNFEWKAPNGDDVDLSRKQEFTMVMKHPLQAQICARIHTHL
ncbi:cytochrome P450 89A2-like [Abrus precatorius]|uniref:Cytochrome P450 89A2-like n=1 Tax=Abrus precatorius TaxID=3816 RepID=A0A8B8KW91_ABRPR|nr:cytochrome P450 89A2-like [Abrus precatorius]